MALSMLVLCETPTTTSSALSGIASARPGLTSRSPSFTSGAAWSDPHQHPAAIALDHAAVQLLGAGMEDPSKGLAGDNLTDDLLEDRSGVDGGPGRDPLLFEGRHDLCRHDLPDGWLLQHVGHDIGESL